MSGYTVAGLGSEQLVVSEGDTVALRNSVNEVTLASGVAKVVDPHTLDGVLLSGNLAIIQNGIGNFDVTDFGAGGGEVAVIARVSTNLPSVQLANATTKIAVNAAPITLSCTNGKTAPATIAVDQGLWANFPLANTTDTILSDNDLIQVENQGATQNVSGEVSVVNQSGTIKLPPSTAMVANNVAITGAPVTGTFVDTITPQVNAAGQITGFTLS